MLSSEPVRANPPPMYAEALAETPPKSFPRADVQVLWGPHPKEVAVAAGMWAPAPMSTILLRPCVPEKLRQAVLREVPDDVLPRPTDTAASLTARLAASAFLEDSHVLKDGKGPRRVRLNATRYPEAAE